MSASTVNEIFLYEVQVRTSYEDVRAFNKWLKEQRAMLKSAYENDSEYAELQEKAKEIKRQQAAVKERIERDSSVGLIKAKIKDLKEELKDAKDCLNRNLQANMLQTKSSHIEIDGELYKVIPSYKLAKNE